MNNIIKTMLSLSVVLAMVCVTRAQSRDRRVDLDNRCLRNVSVSSTGQLWMCDWCGHVWVADSIGTTWRTAFRPDDEDLFSENSFERVAAFGNGTAVAMGFLQPEGFVLRTTDGGLHWDTLNVDENLVWVRSVSYHADGRMWMASAEGRAFKSLSYSTDCGRTFTALKPSFVKPNDDEDGIKDLYMVSADSGLAGTYGNGLYFTANNWRTVKRLSTPLDQGLLQKNDYRDTWMNRVRLWRHWIIVTESSTVACTPFGSTLNWKPMPLPVRDYEVDTVSGCLWVITANSQLVLMEDMEHWRVVRDTLGPGSFICGVLGGNLYLDTPDGVVRVRPDGQADTCGFFTEEKTLEQVFDEVLQSEYAKYEDNLLPSFLHGGRVWRMDGRSVYLQDDTGWYRVAKPLGICEMHPDPYSNDGVVVLLSDERNYRVDAKGHITPFIYRQPFKAFLDDGLESVEINTYYSGCFSHQEDVIRYTRQGDRLFESQNTMEESPHTVRVFPVDTLERALQQLGECYSRFPSLEDFGLREGELDLEEVLRRIGGCTSYAGYEVTITNRSGERLCFHGTSSAECGDYFPWLLPMCLDGKDVSFVTYQPLLWKALRPMMPEGMKLRKHLGGYEFLLPGDLLFFRDTDGMGAAVEESTGTYTHVAIVESVGDTVWIIDATPKNGVARRPYLRQSADKQSLPDIYRLEYRGDVDSALIRARSFVGRPYDNAFLPDNGAFYCSELVYECFLSGYSMQGDRHLFEAKPMNWRNADGELPKYWVKHFKKLKKPVPEGVMGTNPTDLSRSPLLRKL